MSTRKLLNRDAERQASMRRSQAVMELRRLAYSYGEGTPGRFRMESIVEALEQVRKDPRFSGAEKDAKFKSLLNRAR